MGDGAVGTTLAEPAATTALAYGWQVTEAPPLLLSSWNIPIICCCCSWVRLWFETCCWCIIAFWVAL